MEILSGSGPMEEVDMIEQYTFSRLQTEDMLSQALPNHLGQEVDINGEEIIGY